MSLPPAPEDDVRDAAVCDAEHVDGCIDVRLVRRVPPARVIDERRPRLRRRRKAVRAAVGGHDAIFGEREYAEEPQEAGGQ